MSRVFRVVRRVQGADEAMAASEYALVLGLVALLLFFVMSAYGANLKTQWQKVNGIFKPPACDNSSGSASDMNPNCQ